MGPLLDCVLQLLIFFMLSSTFAAPKLGLSLPQARASDGVISTDAVVISADSSGRIYVNQKQVEAGELAGELGRLVKEKPERAVSFRGDMTIPFQTFVQVLDAAKQAGVRNLDIAHDLQRGPAP